MIKTLSTCAARRRGCQFPLLLSRPPLVSDSKTKHSTCKALTLSSWHKPDDLNPGSCLPRFLWEGGYDCPYLTHKDTEAEWHCHLPTYAQLVGTGLGSWVLNVKACALPCYYAASLPSTLIFLTHLGASVLLGGRVGGLTRSGRAGRVLLTRI